MQQVDLQVQDNNSCHQQANQPVMAAFNCTGNNNTVKLMTCSKQQHGRQEVM